MPPLSRGALVALVLGLLAAWPQPFLEQIRSPNELVRLYLTRAIVDDGSLTLDAQFSKRGRLLDHAAFQGRTYCDKAPGLSLLAVPFYAAARLVWTPEELTDATLIRWFRFLLLTAPTLGFLVVLRRWLVSLDLPSAVVRLTPLAYLVGTPAIVYCAQFVGHQAAAWMIGGALAAAWSHRDSGTNTAWIAGLLAATAAVTEYPAAPMLGIVGWLSINSRKGVRRSLGSFATGAAAPLTMGALYHTIAFGNPFTTGYSHIAHAGFSQVHDSGLLGVGLPSPSVIWEITFGLERGLFFLAPWLLLSLFAWKLPAPRRPLTIALALNVLLHAWIASGFGHWIGGWAVGPRHMVAALPSFAMLAALGWSQLGWAQGSPRVWVTELARGLVSTSVAICSIVALTFPAFPEDINHPLRDFTLALLQDLQGTHSLGTQLLGMPASVSLLMGVALAIVTALAVLLLERPRLTNWFAVAVVVAAACTSIPFLLPEAPTERAIFRVAWLREKVWEPKEAVVVRDPRYVRWERAKKRFKNGKANVEDLDSLAAVAERVGNHEKAAELHRKADALRDVERESPRTPRSQDRQGSSVTPQ